MLLIVSLAILLSGYLYDVCGLLAILVMCIECNKRGAKDPHSSFARSHAALVQHSGDVN